MEHPEAVVAERDIAEDGVAALLAAPAQEQVPPRTLRQVLLVVVGWVVVLAIACVVIVLAAPAIETVIVAIVRAVTRAGQP